VNASAASIPVAGIAGATFLLLSAERETALSHLPREDNPGDADDFCFDFETLLFHFAHLGVQVAAVIALGAALVASGLVKALASGDLWCVDHLRGKSHQ
jgi:hypothetical protein